MDCLFTITDFNLCTSPWEFIQMAQEKNIVRDSLVKFSNFIMKMYLVCTYENHLDKTILVSTLNIPLFYSSSKRNP